MKIVTKNNRVVAHGGDYIVMGGTVIDTKSQKMFTEATVVECDSCPPDIDIAGYEYHSGRFFPCAPFGVGSGNLAVVCNEDCKSIKDSGFSIDTFAGMEVLPYTGTGYGIERTLEFKTIEPTIVFFQAQKFVTSSKEVLYSGYVIGGFATAIIINSAGAKNTIVGTYIDGKNVVLHEAASETATFNEPDVPYIAVGFGKRVN